MNGREIEHYLDKIYATYDKSIMQKYSEWSTTNPLISFDEWAELYHPQWYEQFGNRNARSN